MRTRTPTRARPSALVYPLAVAALLVFAVGFAELAGTTAATPTPAPAVAVAPAAEELPESPPTPAPTATPNPLVKSVGQSADFEGLLRQGKPAFLAILDRTRG